jgi:hypothetical protein
MWKSVIILTKQNLPQAIPYFCMRCRNRLFHINRDILVMYLGEPYKEIPRGMGEIEIKCRGCEYVYTFYWQ